MVFDICGYMSAIREPLCDDQEKNISISCLLLAFTVMIVPCGRLWLCFWTLFFRSASSTTRHQASSTSTTSHGPDCHQFKLSDILML